MLQRLFGPLFVWEMTRSGRNVRAFLLRCALPIGLLVYFFIAAGRIYQRADYPLFAIPGKRHEFQTAFTTPVLQMTFFFCLLVAPAMFAPLIARDRESRVIELLAAARLTRKELLLGRWGAQCFQMLLSLLAAAPILLAAEGYGGTRASSILASLFVSFCTVFSTSSLSMTASSLARSTREAITAAYALLVLALFFPGGLAVTVRTLHARSAAPGWLTQRADYLLQHFDEHVNPLNVFEQVAHERRTLFDEELWARLALFGVVHLVLGLVFWCITAWMIQPAAEEAARSIGQSTRRIFQHRAFRFERWPIFEREWRTRCGGVMGAVQSYVWFIAAATALYLPFFSPIFRPFPVLWHLFGDWRETDYVPYYLYIGGALFAVSLAMVIQNAVNALHSERGRDTWQMLLSASWTTEEIVLQKVAAAVRPTVLLLLLWAPVPCWMAKNGFGDYVGAAALWVIAPAFAIFTAAAGFWCVMRVSRSLATGVALGLCLGVFLSFAVAQKWLVSSYRPAPLKTQHKFDLRDDDSAADGVWLLSTPFLLNRLPGGGPDGRSTLMLSAIAFPGVGALFTLYAVRRFPSIVDRYDASRITPPTPASKGGATTSRAE